MLPAAFRTGPSRFTRRMPGSCGVLSGTSAFVYQNRTFALRKVFALHSLVIAIAVA